MVTDERRSARPIRQLGPKMGPKTGGYPFFGFLEKTGYKSPSQPTPLFLALLGTTPPASLPLTFWQRASASLRGGRGSGPPMGSTRGPRGVVSDKIFSKKRKIWGGAPPSDPKNAIFGRFLGSAFLPKEVFGPPETCGSLTPDKFELLMVTLKETPPRILEIWTKVVSGEAPPRDP